MKKMPFAKLLFTFFLVFFPICIPGHIRADTSGVLLASKENTGSGFHTGEPVNSGRAFEETAKINAATEVLREILKIPEQVIPPALLRNAHGIAIIPGIIKAAFFLGGRYGSGVLLVHTKDGGWSDPVFLKLMGGGFGWQFGVQSTDVILVFKSSKSIDGLARGKFTLGADASVAAGPVGRSVEAATDMQLKAEIYSYSRNRGLFAGVSLEGAAIQIDNDADEVFYGIQGIRAADIVDGRQAGYTSVQDLKNILEGYASEHNME